MSRKKIIWFTILFLLLIGGLYAYREYSRTNPDISELSPDFTLTATEIIREFEQSDAIASGKYNGKIIELTGNVKSIDRDAGGYITIVLGDTIGTSSVRCSIDSNHQQHAALTALATSAIVRGVCTGFNKDDLGIGSDVILNRCVIIDKNHNH